MTETPPPSPEKYEAYSSIPICFKEVLRRENQGLKVYKVDGSLVFNMTGTYFQFVLSMLSGLIFKRTPEAGTLFSYHSSCAE